MKPFTLRKAFFACFLLFTAIGFAQEFNAFDIRYQNNLKGDLTFIGNNIVNRQTSSEDPEDPYNTTGNSSQYNDLLDMQYIDVDADPSTFSSSTATFSYNGLNCNLIRYAGLYWTATYPSEQAGQAVGTNRQSDFNQVRFRVPGGSYVDITADEIIYDGFTSTDTSVQENSPYACYADVTSLVTALADPQGDYTVANIRSVTGSLFPGGGASAGWTLVIVYENPTLTGKLITTFDGFARVRSANPTVDINYNGFNTIPAGPVRANIGVAALEGDNRITGDQLQIRAASNASFTNISDGANPATNFFNSNITLNGSVTTNRNPNSVNTLGYDTDMFLLNNPLNGVIPNSETAATFRFTSTGDQYYPFFNSFNVEIIEPNIVLEKRVEDIAGNDITGAGVNLGQLLDYVLSFENSGNDDATNYTIRDVLPINVTLDEMNLTLPAGVTYTYDPLTREVIFSIPDNIVEAGDPISSIRMRVQVAENCFDFIDACTDLIENLAYSTYEGVINDNQITDDPSVSDFDSCGFVTPGATNFLLDDLENCDFSRTVELCGNNVILDAGDNFDDYIWYEDNNNNGVVDAGDTVITDGDPDNDLSTLIVSDTGTYIVDKIVADPCKGFEEIITVVTSGSAQANPIVALINDPTNTVEGEVVVCPNDGEELPKIFLCGLNDTELIEINIPDAVSIEWERLDEASCADAGDDCANKNSACTWNQVDTGFDFVAADAGKYRVVISYLNGCFSRFYFDIFKNPLNPQYNQTDIICATPGNITVTNMPVDYEYQLLDATNGNILVPFSAGNGPSFDIATNGAYTIEMQQVGVTGGCIFRLENIGVLSRDFQVDITTTEASCSGLGSITVSALNVEPQYYYEISQAGTTVDTSGPSNDNNYTFENLSPGVYDVLLTTDDGCSYTEQVTIVDNSDLELIARVSQHISCREGNIQMDSNGGQTPHTYAIYSYVDESGVTQISYPDPTAIPPSEFQTSQIFDILDAGTYTFVVVDRNNCFSISNPVDIEFIPAVDIGPTTVINEQCFGDATGSITYNILDTNGYQLTFYLYDDAGTLLATNGSGVFTGLPQGDYTVILNQRKGSASCDFSLDYTISGPANALDATAALIQPYSCTQTATIEAQNTTGGTAPYEYSIDGINFVSGAGAETFTGLTPGNYTITVRDANGCTYVTNAIDIIAPPQPDDLSFVATQPVCPALVSDVTATVANGTAPFVFEIIAPAAISATSITGNSAQFNGLAPDTYTFQVTDANGCTYQENFTISPVVPIQVDGILVSDVSCVGDTDGSIDFTVGGFATSYSYDINGGATLTGQTATTINLTGQPAGTYTITVTDEDTNCVDTAIITISEPANPLAFTLSVSPLTCTSDGAVTVSATDGWGGYQYELTQPDATTVGPQGSNTFGGLTLTGTYTISVTDAGGCTVTDTFDLTNPSLPTVSLDPLADLCYDPTTGVSLIANVSGGNAPFTYSLNGGAGQSSNQFDNLAPGSYTVTVVDNFGCSVTSAAVVIEPQLTLSPTLTKELDCSVSPDAIIDITINGGYAPFNYTVNSGAPVAVVGNTFTFTTAVAGSFTFEITDAEGCVEQTTVVVDPITNPQATATPTDVSCNGFTDGAAEIVIDPNFGTAPYQVNFDGAGFASQLQYSGLAAGTYTYVVQDAKGCTFTDTVTINEPTSISADAVLIQPYTCLQTATIELQNVLGGTAPYSYSIDGVNFVSGVGSETFTGLTDGTYTLTVRDANGCEYSPAAIVIAPLDPPTDIVFAATAPNCPAETSDVTLTVTGGTAPLVYEIIAPAAVNNGNNNVFAALSPDTYTFRVTDANGCEYEENFTISPVTPVQLSGNVTTEVSCVGLSDGALTLNISDFVSTYSYTVNAGAPVTAQSSNTINLTGLAAGSYTIEVTDETTNCTDTITLTITEPATPLSFTFVDNPITCDVDGSVTINAVGGWGAYSYEIEQPDTTVLGPQSSNFFSGLNQAGTYTITVTDAGGCSVTDTFTLSAPTNPTASIDPSSDLCYSSADAADVVIGATGGLAPYFYSINGGPNQPSNTFNNLLPGNYTFTVTDSNGCSDTVNLTIEPELTVTASLIKDLDCTVTPDAQIDLTVNGGYTPYSYEINVNSGGYVAYAGPFPYVASAAGTYQFRVTDNQGCIAESNIITIATIANPVATTNNTDPTCNGDANGIIEVVVDPNFGLAPYEIDFDGAGFSSQTVYPGLPAGTYNYTVRDAKGCTYTDSATLTNPDPFLANVVPTDVSCGGAGVGDIPGRIDITITGGGVPNYTYTLYDNLNNIVPVTGANPIVNTAATSVTFDGLAFGDYYVRIIDANGCEYYENPVRVLANPYLSLNSTVIVDCPTGGTVEVSSDGGSGDYTFSIYGSGVGPTTEVAGPGANEETATFTGLNPGQTYIFQVVDNITNCTSFLEETIPALSTIDVVATPTVTDVSCFGDTNGSITFQIEGFDAGVTDINYDILESLTNTSLGAGYTGTITQPAGGPTATPSVTVNNIPPGDYVLFFQEGSTPFCSNTYNFRILEPVPVTLDLVDLNNGNCNEDAQVTVIAGGGTPGYTYAFVQDGVAPVAGDYSASNYAELDPDVNTEWDVYAMDASGCLAPVLDVSIANDPSPVISATTNQCAADEGGFVIDITLDVAGISPHTISVNGGAFQSTSMVNAGDTHQLSGLNSGSYTIEVRDSNGCGNTINVDIFPPNAITAQVTVFPSCTGADGEVVVTATGGSGNYLYELFLGAVSVSGGPQASPTFSGLDPGAYTAFVYDQVLAGCDASVPVTLDTPTAVSFTASTLPVSCAGGSDGSVIVTLDAGMDNPPYTYELYDNTGLVLQAGPQTSPIFNNLSAADYVVRVISGRGCVDNQTVTVNEPLPLTVSAAATAFVCSPDNTANQSVITVTASDGTAPYLYSIDGVNFFANNTFEITDTGVTQNITVTVQDANGCMDTDAVIIEPLNTFTAVVTQNTAISCSNPEEVLITVTDDGNPANTYTFELLPTGNPDGSLTSTPTNVTATFELTEPGSYVFRITDNSTGCYVDTAAYDIAPYDLIEVVAAEVTPVSCFGDANGEMSITVNNYTGNYTYQVFDATATPITGVIAADTSVNPRTIGSLNGGSYYVEVIATDMPFCNDLSNTITISSPSTAVGLGLVSNINANCNIGAQLTVAGTGGTPGYTYAFMPTGSVPVAGDYSANASAVLSPATYPADFDVYVMDSNGCFDFITVTVDEDPLPTVTAPAYATDQCTSDGTSYTFTVVGTGVAPLNYSIGNGFQTSDTFTVNAPGTYTVTVRDANGCTATDTIIILPPLNITPVVNAQPSCLLNDGEISITASGGSGSFEYDLLDGGGISVIGGVPQASSTFSGLAPDTYTAIVYDTSGSGCDAQATIVLEIPTPVTFDPHTLVDVSCFGGSDGSITVNLTPTAAGVNDNPPYEFNLYDNGGVLITGPQTSPLFAGLSAGTYEVEAISERGCSLRETVVINEPLALTVSAAATSFSCAPNNTVNLATITATVPVGEGTAPYFYSIDNINFQTSNTFTVADTGISQNITVFVRDSNGCVATDNVTIEPLNTFTAAVTQNVAISCANPEEILISITDDGNPANTYTFDLLPLGNPDGTLISNPSNTSAVFELTEVGSYVFRITDNATGCYIDTAPYDIAPYDLITVSATAQAPVSCFGDANGEISLNINGYSGPYNYEVFTDAGVTTGIIGNGDSSLANPLTITGISGGNYFVRVTETAVPLCQEDSNIITIVSPDSPLAAVLSEVSNVTCTDDQGEILVAISGGVGPFDLVLTNTTTTQVYTSTANGDYVFTGLSAGAYTLQLTDALGCVVNDAINLVAPAPITADITPLTTALSCFGDTNASLTAINVLGGEGTYQYQLNVYDATGTTIEFTTGPQLSDTFDNLGAGIYSITVSDGWNCDVETVQATITEPTEVMANLIQLSMMSCTTNATLELTAAGGTGPYEYSEDNIAFFPMSGGNTHVFSVTPGVYQYYVRDAVGCVATISNQVDVEPVDPLTINVDTSAAMVNCTGESTATLIAEAAGGLGNYMYELYNDAGLTNLLAGPQSSGEFNNLAVGDYYIRVTSQDCEETTTAITVSEPAPLVIDQESFTNVTCPGEDDGTITVEVSGGTGEILYAISPNLNQFDDVNVFTDLAPGIYDVIAQDRNGCFILFQFDITEPTALQVDPTITPEVCTGAADGAIDIVISGGTAPYRTAFNSNLDADFVPAQLSYTDLAAGTYVIFVRDANDCETNIIVEVPAGVNLNATVTPMYECTGDTPDNFLEVILEDPSVANDVMYALDSTDPADMQLDANFTNIAPGTHFLAIAHSNGCIQTYDFEIDSFEPLTLVLEQNNINEITAIAGGGVEDYTFYFNNDDNGTDNTYFITETGTYQVRVVDQSGCEVIQEIFMEFIDIEIPNFFTPDGDGINDTWIPRNIEGWPQILIKIFDRYGRVVAEVPYGPTGWDGTYNGSDLPTGDYWYVIKLNGENDDREFVGHFTLYR